MEMREGFNAPLPMAEGTHRRVLRFAVIVLLVALLSPFVTARASAAPPAGVAVTVQVLDCRGPVNVSGGVFNPGTFRSPCVGVGGVSIDSFVHPKWNRTVTTGSEGWASFVNQAAGSAAVYVRGWAPAGPVMAACSYTDNTSPWFQPASVWSYQTAQGTTYATAFATVPNQAVTCFIYSTPALSAPRI